MIRNYFKIALRNLRKYKGYSLINISGLALGITCCALIALTVLNEIYFNTFHENTDRIFCVGNYQTFEGNIWYVSNTPALLAPSLKEEFPEVECATRYTGFGRCLVHHGERSFFENGVYHVDPSFLLSIVLRPLFPLKKYFYIQLPVTEKISNRTDRRVHLNTNLSGWFQFLPSRVYRIVPLPPHTKPFCSSTKDKPYNHNLEPMSS